MSKPDKAMLMAVIVITVFAVGFFLNRQGFKTLSILPELDNRINYCESESQYVLTKSGVGSATWENNLFIADASLTTGFGKCGTVYMAVLEALFLRREQKRILTGLKSG